MIEPQHGTRARFRKGCRCRPCRAANAAYEALRVRRKLWAKPGEGTPREWAVEARRRVRQLEIEGYPKSRIAKMAGWADGRGYHVDFRKVKTIRRSTFNRIVAVARFAQVEGTDDGAGEESTGWDANRQRAS